MAFTESQVGIERDATQVLFDAPPIIMDRHMEGGPARSYEIAITNSPCVVEYKVNVDKAKLKIRVPQMTAAQMAILETLIGATGPVTVKVEAGTSATIVCGFGPRSEHQFLPYTGDYPDGDKTGGALPSTLTTYNATISLLRL